MNDLNKIFEERINSGKIAISIISIISSILIIIVYCVYNNLRTLTYKLVLAIAFSEFFNLISNFIFIINKENVKEFIYYIIRFLSCFFDCFSLLILLHFSKSIYDIICKSKTPKFLKDLTIIISISLLYSLIINLMYYLLPNNPPPSNNPLTTFRINLNEDFNKYCISHSLIMTLISIINVIYSILTIKYIYSIVKDDDLNGWKIIATCNSLSNFALIGISNWFFLWIGFIIYLFNKKNETYNGLRLKNIFYILSEIFVNLRSLLIFLVFLSTIKVQNNLKTSFNKILLTLNLQSLLFSNNKN
jgi:hypothetical protein